MSNTSTPQQVIRFLIVGGVNTLATFAIFFALALLIPVDIAYTVAFLAGLAWVVVGSSRLVFGGRHSLVRLVGFALAYLGIYLVGRLLIWIINPDEPLGLALLTLALIVVTTPLSFMAGRLILTRRPDAPPHTKDPSP